MAALAALAVIASACSHRNEAPVIRTVTLRPQIPASARTPCATPALLPDRDLTQAEVAAGWGHDRAALRACEARRRSLVAAVDGGR